MAWSVSLWHHIRHWKGKERDSSTWQRERKNRGSKKKHVDFSLGIGILAHIVCFGTQSGRVSGCFFLQDVLITLCGNMDRAALGCHQSGASTTCYFTTFLYCDFVPNIYRIHTAMTWWYSWKNKCPLFCCFPCVSEVYHSTWTVKSLNMVY